MTTPSYAVLDERAALIVGGGDARSFLQGMISNDVERVGPTTATYSAFLTPQGKYLHDFFLTELDGTLMLDCEAGRMDDLAARLKRFKLRADVTLSPAADRYRIAALMGDGAAAAFDLPADAVGQATPFAGGVVYVDPRLAAAGLRAILPADAIRQALEDKGFAAGSADDYDISRIGLGLPDGSRDLVVEKSVLMESGFDELNGVDWRKGCYIGQELTARTKYRGLVKKRLMPVAIEGPVPAAGAPIFHAEREAGEMRSAAGNQGLALIRLDAYQDFSTNGGAMTADGARLSPRRPAWANFGD